MKVTVLFAFCLLTFLAATSITYATNVAFFSLNTTFKVGDGVCLEFILDDKPITQFDWGVLEPNEQKTVHISLHNYGDKTSNLLHMTSEITPDVGVLTWDVPENKVLEPDEYLDVAFTLTVHPYSPKGDFKCLITVSA